jgi:transposase
LRRIGRRLRPDHLARRIDRLVDRLDLRPLRDAYAGTGSRPYHPRLLLKVALYETQSGHHSPALWCRHARESEPVRWLARGAEPARSRWYAFRDRLGKALDDLNRQVLALALDRRLTDARQAALDGSFVAANASRHRLLRADVVRQRLLQLEQACAADAAGPAPARPGWMAPTAGGRRRQRHRYRQALECLRQRQQQRQRQRGCDRHAAQPLRLNPADPEAVPGRDKEKVYRPLFDVQLLRDLDSPLILAYDVFARASDAGTLGPMLQRARQLLGRLPPVWLCDATYASGPDLRQAEEAGVTLYAPPPRPAGAACRRRPPAWLPKEAFDWLAREQVYRCPRGQRLERVRVRAQQRAQQERVQVQEYRCAAEHCRGCPLAVWCTPRPDRGRTINRSAHEDRFERLRQRMATPQAEALYRRRGQTVELSFADAKGHRQLRRFSGRGLMRARVQVGLVVLAHNGLVVLRASEAEPAAPQTQAS